MRGRRALPTILLLLAGAATAMAEETAIPDGFRLDSFRWHGQAAAGDLIRVSNAYGDVRIRASDSDAVSVTAQLQRFGGHDDLDLEVTPREDGIDVTVIRTLPTGTKQEPGRADVALLLPAGTRVEATTTAGMIRVKNARSDVVARTTHGLIQVTTAHRVVARTDGGRIEATLGGGGWSGPASLVSGTGDIDVHLPSTADLSIEVRAGGGVRTEWPPELAVEESRDGQRVALSLGDGEARLDIVTETGKVRLEVAHRRERP